MTAREAVDAIAGDLGDRRGLGQMWRSIDDGIRDQIVEGWRTFVAAAIKSAISDFAKASRARLRRAERERCLEVACRACHEATNPYDTDIGDACAEACEKAIRGLP